LRISKNIVLDKSIPSEGLFGSIVDGIVKKAVTPNEAVNSNPLASMFGR